ncbi:MAG: GNAT family N-acetyltransferase [bacterium]
MTYEIRPFALADLPAVVALYGRVLSPLKPRYCWPLNVERLQRQYFGHPEFRMGGLFIAVADGAIVGFAFGAVRTQPITPEDELAGVSLSLILVDEAYRRRGIGSALLEKVAEFGRAYGKDMFSAHACMGNPVAFWPGVNRSWVEIVAFLRAHKFTTTHCEVSMDQHIADFHFTDYVASRHITLLAEGYRFIPYEDSYHDALLRAAGNPSWHLDLQSKIDRLPNPFIETAFLNLDRDNIYGPQEITLAVHDGVLIGFVALCRNPGEEIAYLGPIRITEALNHVGLGSVMIQTAIQREQQRGTKIIDLWCSENNAQRFYTHNGFLQHDVWDMYERVL